MPVCGPEISWRKSRLQNYLCEVIRTSLRHVQKIAPSSRKLETGKSQDGSNRPEKGDPSPWGVDSTSIRLPRNRSIVFNLFLACLAAACGEIVLSLEPCVSLN